MKDTPWWWAKAGMWPVHVDLLPDADYRALLSVIINKRAGEKSNKATVEKLLTIDDEASKAAFKAIAMIGKAARDELVASVSARSPYLLIPELVTILGQYGLEDWRKLEKRQ